jgi:hypothetical protein
MIGWGDVIGGPKVWARDLAMAVAIGAAIAFLGPFGSYELPLERRLLTSISYGLAGSIVLWPTVRLVRMLGERWGLPEWFGIGLALVVGAAPVAVSSWLVSAVLNPARADYPPLAQYLAVLAIVFPFGLAMILYDRMASRPPPAPAVEAEPGRPRLLARLPGRLGEDVIALQAEDHYVRVHTALGSDLLLMRFADAVAEADGIDGLRVHRSWWVARGAVESGRAEGRRATLTLKTGLDVPVTRELVPEVRKAGWL